MKMIVTSILLAAGALGLTSLPTQAESYIMFGPTPPTSGGLSVTGMNSNNDVTGYFRDSDGQVHSFIFQPTTSTFTEFAFPGAFGATSAYSINDTGTIVGTYTSDSQGDSRGFIRSPDGTMTPYDGPYAVNTALIGINNKGDLLGVSTTSPGPNGSTSQPFVAFSNGGIYPIIDPVASTITLMVTHISDSGDVSGTEQLLQRGKITFRPFVRLASGSFQSYSVGPPIEGATGINASGTAVGYAYAESCVSKACWVLRSEGYLRNTDGTTQTFSVQPGFNNLTYPVAINSAGTVTGYYTTPTTGTFGYGVGFVRAADGNVTTFTVPESYGETPVTINDAGTVAGMFESTNGFEEGFIRLP